MSRIIQAAIFITIILILSLLSPSLFKQTNKNTALIDAHYLRHQVKENESLTEIAIFYYKNAEYWTNIWNDNPQILNPSLIEKNTILKIRRNTPQSIEAVDSFLMDRLLKFLSTQTLDINLAFANAGGAVAYDTKNNDSTLAGKISSANSQFDDIYKQAGEKYGIPWQVLYGLHLTESNLRDGTITNSSNSGAQGPMQFMPRTWKYYGVDGNGDGISDINNTVDAIYGAANFLARHNDLLSGLKSYGGNTTSTLAAACSKGYCL